MNPDARCALSIVITVVGGEQDLRKCLDLLIPQTARQALEIIVPYDSTIEDIGLLASEYPQACFLKTGALETVARTGSLAAAHELYDMRKAIGLAVGRGQILALLDDNGYPAPDWCEQIIQAHQLPHGVIGGGVEQVGKGILNWAIYFPDFGRYQPPIQEGPAKSLTDINVSYKREILYAAKDVWAHRYNEVSVHWALSSQGVVLWRRPQMVVHLDRGTLSFPELARQRYAWGRLFGTMRGREISSKQRIGYILTSPAIPILLLGRMAWRTFRIRRNRLHFLRALPIITILTLLWSLGEAVGTITQRDS